MTTKYDQIVHIDKIGASTDFDMNEVMKMAASERVKASITDRKKSLLLLVNYQKDFFKEGLFDIPNVKEDAQRISKFIYDNLEGISRIITSLDTHIAQQIYHPCWWVDEVGNHPKEFTTITDKEVSQRKWIPTIGSFKDNLEYLQELEIVEGRHLCIWPYYAISGTEGSSLENEIAKMVYFHSIARNSVNNIIWNGLDFYTQAFGCINTEYKNVNLLNAQLLMAVERYDKVFIAGENVCHGMLDIVKMIARYYRNEKNIIKKITVLMDCTSSIRGYEHEMREELAALEKMYGIKLKQSTEIKL